MAYNDDPRTLSQMAGLQNAYPEWKVPSLSYKKPGTGFSQDELSQMGVSQPLPGGYLGGDQDEDVAMSVLAQLAPSMGLQGTNRDATKQVSFEDPLADQRAQVAADEAAQRKAIMSGFTGAKPQRASAGTIGVNEVPKFTGSAPSPTEQMGATQRMLELEKVLSPEKAAKARASSAEEAARIKAEGALEQEKTKGASAEKRANDLLEMLKGAIQGNTLGQGGRSGSITLPGGAGIHIGAEPALASGAGKGTQADVDKWEKERSNLQGGGLSSWWMGGAATKKRIDELSSNLVSSKQALNMPLNETDKAWVAANQGQTTAPPPAPAAGAGDQALRQQAADALKAAGHPVTDANVAYVMKQLQQGQ